MKTIIVYINNDPISRMKAIRVFIIPGALNTCTLLLSIFYEALVY